MHTNKRSRSSLAWALVLFVLWMGMNCSLFSGRSEDPGMEEVASFYQEALPPQGWTITERGNADGTLIWEASRQEVMDFLPLFRRTG